MHPICFPLKAIIQIVSQVSKKRNKINYNSKVIEVLSHYNFSQTAKTSQSIFMTNGIYGTYHNALNGFF